MQKQTDCIYLGQRHRWEMHLQERTRILCPMSSYLCLLPCILEGHACVIKDLVPCISVSSYFWDCLGFQSVVSGMRKVFFFCRNSVRIM